jgi:hypothetical protein
MKTIGTYPQSYLTFAARTASGFGLLLLAGRNLLSFSNEGAVDYRKAEIIRFNSSDRDVAAIAPGAGPGGVVKAQAPSVGPGPVSPARLHRQALRGTDSDALIQKGDSVSIHLRTAMLRNFEAIAGSGEIAVVVKAFEFGKGEDFKFGPDAVRQGRLVFYSPDVDKGQVLNFNNLPVYGPITYGGNPIGIDISVIEIDAGGPQIAALLGTLATLGGQAYPPAAPILPVLNALGQSLLNGDMNDTEMRFTLMLNPGEGYAGVSYPTTEAGDYVFVREENRTATTPWHELEVDTNTGRVYRNGSPYVDNTYLTFQINKNLSSIDIDLSQNTFGDFMDELDKEDAEQAKDLEPFLAELQKLGIARVQTHQFGEARELLTRWQNARKEGHVGEAKRAAFKLVDLMQKAITAQDAAQDPSKAPELSVEQIDYLLDKLAMMAGAGTHSDLELFTTERFQTASFEELFAAVQGV